MVKRPKGDFHDASHHTPVRQSQLKDPLDLNPPRDKTNAEQEPAPPRFAPGGGAANLAPRGTLGTKLDLPVPTAHKADIDLEKAYPESQGWVHGRLASMQGYGFSVKMSDLPARENLNDGKIEKMVIYRENTPVVNFDRGWNIKPLNARDIKAVEKVRNVFDPRVQDVKSIASKMPDKDRGHSR